MTFKRVTEAGTVYVCAAPVKENVVNAELANAVVHGLNEVVGGTDDVEFVEYEEYVPDAQIVHTRSFVEVAAIAKNVPAGQVCETETHADPSKYCEGLQPPFRVLLGVGVDVGVAVVVVVDIGGGGFVLHFGAAAIPRLAALPR